MQQQECVGESNKELLSEKLSWEDLYMEIYMCERIALLCKVVMMTDGGSGEMKDNNKIKLSTHNLMITKDYKYNKKT